MDGKRGTVHERWVEIRDEEVEKFRNCELNVPTRSHREMRWR